MTEVKHRDTSLWTQEKITDAFLDILGNLKNAHKNPKFGRVRQVPIKELGWELLLELYCGTITEPGLPVLRQQFLHSLTPPRFGALNLPEVNQFTGNCFRMVCIVLKITFLKLRYPKGVTGRLPLCPIMALDMRKSYKRTKDDGLWKSKRREEIESEKGSSLQGFRKRG